MTREAVINSLKTKEATAVDLAKEFDRSVVAIEEDIEHIRTTLRKDPDFELIMQPAQCLLCDYLFSSEKAKAPTRCPNCKREKIRIPRFKIMPKK